MSEADTSKRERILSRRNILRAGVGAIGVAGLAGIWTWQVEPFLTKVERHTLFLRGLPDALVGKTMMQVSDIHVGKAEQDHLEDAIERVNAERPDLIVFTGDFMSAQSAARVPHVTRLLRNLKPPPLGMIGCLGNHDYGANWAISSIADMLCDHLSTIGVRMLKNDFVDLAGLRICAFDDFWGPRFPTNSISLGFNSSRDAICLCHNPDACDEPLWDGFAGVILSGHTHGGQCKPPFLPPPILPVKNRRYTSGFFKLDADRLLYISRGIGYVRQVRFNCRPELTVFRLERA